MEIVDVVQQHYLQVFHPLSRPPTEHEVELPGTVEGLRLQLLENKVCKLYIASKEHVAHLLGTSTP